MGARDDDVPSQGEVVGAGRGDKEGKKGWCGGVCVVVGKETEV